MFKKRRFLLVEDNDAHAKLVMLQFRDNTNGLTIDRVPDGESALAYLRRQGPYAGKDRPDVVLLDLKLPRVNGHEVLRQLKADEDLRGIPVIVLTTSQAEKDMVEAYREYANSYLIKPFDFGSFQRMIEDVANYWGEWNQHP
ncbi:MAG TPA: response regulator [Phycisphaerae bacterium]|jgi:CheY-like chemotaxis protein|nr:response regulator [Phycisphaerae bacterium]HOB73783.1 response regulator [Phycisphaerae bacterium]HOJ56233.1 response regulator [Phycisphaerae bacterium]HOL27119.1 response regulator [Phycisphaerae bacterium]HPP21251.1 response regulator [Phycisphaerae bacterium]